MMTRPRPSVWHGGLGETLAAARIWGPNPSPTGSDPLLHSLRQPSLTSRHSIKEGIKLACGIFKNQGFKAPQLHSCLDNFKENGYLLTSLRSLEFLHSNGCLIIKTNGGLSQQ